MAFNGITINAICAELNDTILGGRIQKISQPEPNGMIFNIHTQSGRKLLYISANASLPLIYLTESSKPSPLTAPNFLMVLRKHIGNARICEIKQFGMERVIRFTLEHLDEMKDVAHKHLYVEIMGKYSNIIFTDSDNRIIDSIKHVSASTSSVREVLPGREYFIPGQKDRLNPFEVDKNTFFNKVLYKNSTISKAIASSFIGFSNITGVELALRCNLDPDTPLDALHSTEKEELYDSFAGLMADLVNHNFSPTIVYNNKNRSIEFSPFRLFSYEGERKESYPSISLAVETFYSKKNSDDLIRQKTADLKKIIVNHLERSKKKLALQERQLLDTKKSEQLQLYGELLLTYGHDIPPKSKSVTVINYYDNNEITIPLDPDLTGIENSKKYFKKYDKLKRTKEALEVQTESSRREYEHLLSIATALDLCENETDIQFIRKELSEYGFIKGKGSRDKNLKKAPPLHFTTPDGFHLYVGKNNYQNEEVTFKIGKGNDWWFHAKKRPGSHVILKNEGGEIPDHVFEQAASLAAYYSSAPKDEIIEVDYVQKKELKRPGHGGPGYVIYYTNYSMNVVADISQLKREN